MGVGSTMQRKGQLGVAVIGAGRIGTLRARLAAKHPCVGFLAISDLDAAKARTLQETTGADVISTNNFEMIERPEVNAVFVSTPEGEHAAPITATPSSPRLNCLLLILPVFRARALPARRR